MTIKQYNEMRTKAANIRNWYLIDGKWHHLTRVVAREIVLSGKYKDFRQATVDEELELDGI